MMGNYHVRFGKGSGEKYLPRAGNSSHSYFTTSYMAPKGGSFCHPSYQWETERPFAG